MSLRALLGLVLIVCASSALAQETRGPGNRPKRPQICMNDAELAAEAAALGVAPDALALAWVLSHPWVGMCLSGAATVAQLRSNAAALRLAPLEPELHARLGAALAQEREAYWAERRALAWN